VAYEVRVHRYVYPAQGNSTRDEESREALRQFIATTVGGSLPELSVGGQTPFTVLFSNLTLEEAYLRVQELRPHLPPYDADSGWYLWVGTRHLTTRNEAL
jgi:hypothetical protein